MEICASLSFCYIDKKQLQQSPPTEITNGYLQLDQNDLKSALINKEGSYFRNERNCANFDRSTSNEVMIQDKGTVTLAWARITNPRHRIAQFLMTL